MSRNHSQNKSSSSSPRALVAASEDKHGQSIFHLLRLSVCIASADLRTVLFSCTKIMRENNMGGKIPQKPIQSTQHLGGPFQVVKPTLHPLTVSFQGSILALFVWSWHTPVQMNKYSFWLFLAELNRSSCQFMGWPTSSLLKIIQ